AAGGLCRDRCEWPPGHVPAHARHRPTAGRHHAVQPGSRSAGVRAAARRGGRRDGTVGGDLAAGRSPASGRRLMPYRSRNEHAVTPQGKGRFPGFDVLDSVEKWDDVTAGAILSRLALPGELAFFTPHDVGVAGPLLDLL